MPNINTFQKYLSELLANPNNTLVNNCSHCIKKAYNNTIIGVNRIGYLIIRGFKMSRIIAKNLIINNKLVLLISKGKIKTMSIEHGITAEQFVGVIKKAAKTPEAIVYDGTRNSYQFYIDYHRDFYRVVIEFDTVPVGAKCVRANIIITLFKNEYYERRIKGILDGRFPDLSIRYEKRSGWALIATDSSIKNISNGQSDVKDKE